MSEEKPRKVGRPRKNPEGKTCAIAVTITKQQRDWLDELTQKSPDVSMSKIVREALDLWYEKHQASDTLENSMQDTYDYSWR